MRASVRLAGGAAVAAAALVAASLLQTSAAYSDSGSGSESDRGLLLRTSVAGSLPSDPALFGVTPGGVPWVVDSGTVRLDGRGRLDVRVRGLVIPTTGVNPVPALAASLACNGTVVATTATVPFATDGDARIRATVTVPDRCLAPTVLLNPNGNAVVYIAVSGDEA